MQEILEEKKLERQSKFAFITILLLFGIAFIFMMLDIISVSTLLSVITVSIVILWTIYSNVEQKFSKINDQLFKLRK